MSDEGLDLQRHLRQHVPAVGFGERRGWSFFDSPSGTQMLDSCLSAIQEYVTSGMANRKQPGPPGDQTEGIIGRARSELAKFLRADGYHVAFGQNTTSLSFALAHAVARKLGGSRATIAVSELEHFANADPWIQCFSERGASVAWIEVDPDTLELRVEQLEKHLAEHDTSLVAITMASNVVGTAPDVGAVSALAHSAGALVVVDGVQAVPHRPVDIGRIDPDIFFCSAYKFYGPHLGIALVKEGVAEQIRPYKLRPAPGTGPEQFETGTQNHEAIAGLNGTFDGLAHLSGGTGGDGARQAIAMLAPIQSRIADWVDGALRGLSKVRVFRPPQGQGSRAPVVAFRVAGRAPRSALKSYAGPASSSRMAIFTLRPWPSVSGWRTTEAGTGSELPAIRTKRKQRGCWTPLLLCKPAS